MVDGHVGESAPMSIRLVYGVKEYGPVAREAVRREVVVQRASVASCLHEAVSEAVCGRTCLEWPRGLVV